MGVAVETGTWGMVRELRHEVQAPRPLPDGGRNPSPSLGTHTLNHHLFPWGFPHCLPRSLFS